MRSSPAHCWLPGAGAVLVALGAGSACRPVEARSGAEILWDTWGVPHVVADDESSLLRAFAWAQMRSHGDLLLRSIGEARGRAAEYWGADHLDADRWVWTADIPERSEVWLALLEDERVRHLEAFAAGVNAYARRHPGELADEVEVVLPVLAADLLAHLQRTIHFSLLCNEGFVPGAERALSRGGSNAWAVGPARSASGHALLLANPHLPWNGRFRLFEAQLECPEYSAYGATFVGFPVLAMAFNEHLGWAHTVNTLDAVDLFELELEEDGYLLDGEHRDFAVRRHVLKVRRPDGGFDEELLEARDSVHGPVLTRAGGRAVALRVAGLERPGCFGQWWDMARATDLAGFETALRQMQLPMFTVLYADAAGNVLHLFGGLTPRRPDPVLDWSGLVPGASSATLWNDYLGYDELPRVLNPAGGWLQNANDPPWTTTFPEVLDPDDFPAYLAPRGMSLRAQHSASMLMEDERISLDELVQYKHSTHVELADRVLTALLPAARASSSERVRRAAAVLERWDGRVDASSRGALLFLLMVQSLEQQGEVFAEPWNPTRPTSTPRGLAEPARMVAALERAATTALERGEALEAPWGGAFRLRLDRYDLPCSGGMEQLGVFRAFDFAPDADGRMRAVGGDCFVAAVEFSDPVRARVLTTYGNATQPGSAHRGDQLPLAAAQDLRPAWLSRAEVEDALELHEWVPTD